jgi:hypothetical protein
MKGISVSGVDGLDFSTLGASIGSQAVSDSPSDAEVMEASLVSLDIANWSHATAVHAGVPEVLSDAVGVFPHDAHGMPLTLWAGDRILHPSWRRPQRGWVELGPWFVDYLNLFKFLFAFDSRLSAEAQPLHESSVGDFLCFVHASILSSGFRTQGIS